MSENYFTWQKIRSGHVHIVPNMIVPDTVLRFFWVYFFVVITEIFIDCYGCIGVVS